MKRKLKKYAAVMLIAALVLSYMPPFAAITILTAYASDGYDEDGATYFVFSDSSIEVTEGNYTDYKISGTELTIKGEGTYIISGSCADGSVTVKKGTTGVILVLNGVTLTSSTTAPIACNKSTGVKIIAASGTVNILTDAAYNNDDNYPDNTAAENAVIKCKDGSQVTICGTGILNINANGKNGIKSGATTDEEGEAYLIIKDVTMNINASVNDAVNAEATLSVLSGNITIDAADDAIHSDYVLNIGSESSDGPTIKINSAYEGLEGADLNIYSGNITIYASDDCLNAANSDLTDYEFTLDIFGGTLYMYTTEGDGIDSNGTLTISGGLVEVWSANTADNQPLDADGEITISGGTVFAAGGSSGMGTTLSNSQPYVIYGSGSSGSNGTPGAGQPGQGGMQPGQSRTTGSSVSITKGSVVTVKDSSDNIIYTAGLTAPCNVSYVIFSDSSLTSGSTYTISADNTTVASAQAQTSGTSDSGSSGTTNPSDSTYEGDVNTELQKFTYDETTQYISGQIVVVEWVDTDGDGVKESTVPKYAPTMKFVSTDGTETMDVFVTATGTNTYYFDRLLAGLTDGKEYVFQVTSGNPENVSQYSTVFVYTGTSAIGSEGELGVVGTQKLMYKTGSDATLHLYAEAYTYEGNVNSLLTSVDYANSQYGDFVSGNIIVTEWIDGVSTVPENTPVMTFESYDGTEVNNVFMACLDGTNTFYFDRNLSGDMDITKEYIFRISLTESNNISAYKSMVVTTNEMSAKEGYLWETDTQIIRYKTVAADGDNQLRVYAVNK